MGVLDQQVTERWAAYCGDCTEVMAGLPDCSVHGSVYSLPFARPGGVNPGMYHYTSSERDLSNSRSYPEFLAHYGFVVAQVARLTMPGRISGVHCTDVASGNHGGDVLADDHPQPGRRPLASHPYGPNAPDLLDVVAFRYPERHQSGTVHDGPPGEPARLISMRWPPRPMPRFVPGVSR